MTCDDWCATKGDNIHDFRSIAQQYFHPLTRCNEPFRPTEAPGEEELVMHIRGGEFVDGTDISLYAKSKRLD
jgi:hypothetical protein